jgi:hypothetical protein
MGQSRAEQLQQLAARATLNADTMKASGHPFVAAVCENAAKDYAKEAREAERDNE